MVRFVFTNRTTFRPLSRNQKRATDVLCAQCHITFLKVIYSLTKSRKTSPLNRPIFVV